MSLALGWATVWALTALFGWPGVTWATSAGAGVLLSIIALLMKR